jgi:hypothetical protein
VLGVGNVTITLVTERKQLTALNVPIEVSAVVVLGDPKRPLYVLPIDQLREVLALYDDTVGKLRLAQLRHERFRTDEDGNLIYEPISAPSDQG